MNYLKILQQIFHKYTFLRKDRFIFIRNIKKKLYKMETCNPCQIVPTFFFETYVSSVDSELSKRK